jgi:hypothetical protein
MRDTIKHLNKVSAVKVGTAIRPRSSVFPCAKIDLMLPTNLPQQHRPATNETTISPSRDKPERRRSVSLCNTPDPSDNENQVDVRNKYLGAPFRPGRTIVSFSLQRRKPLRPTSLHRNGYDLDGSILLHSANTPNAVRELKLPVAPFRLTMKPKTLGALAVRSMGLDLVSSFNSELPFLPNMEAPELTSSCVTPRRISPFDALSPPALQCSAGSLQFRASPMPLKLFIPDDL